MNKLIIVDGHNFLWRAYSIPFKFYSKKNTPLHVVSTYLKLLRRTVTSIYGDSLVVVFDSNTTNNNFELSKDYKANRKVFKKGEDSPYSHLPYIQKVLDFLHIHYLEIPNIEADDIIASIVNSFCKRNSDNKAYIFSSDTDFYQLLNMQTVIVKLKKGFMAGNEHEIINARYIKNKIGIRPSQYVQFKSLTGDSADNIKGIFGVGAITAKKIVCKEINFDFRGYEQILDLNKKLITLNCDCKKVWNFKNFSYRKDVFTISNKEIFKACKF